MIKKSLPYILISIITYVVLYFFLDLKNTDLNIPISDLYTNTDGRMTLASFKQIINGECSLLGPLKSQFLSAPFSFEAYDYPTPMFIAWLYVKILSIFSSDVNIVFNLFIISTFFLNAFSMFYILGKLRIHLLISIAIAVLFTFLPFHLFRMGHIFYIGYFFLPFYVYVILLLWKKKPLFFKMSIEKNRYVFDYSKKNIFIILILLISSTWNFYYTFFFLMILGFISISILLVTKNKYHLYSIILVGFFALSPFVANLIPYKLQTIENGKNIYVAQRNPIESEIYGLKIVQMLLPVTYHQNNKLDKVKEKYNTSTILFNESQDATLGFFASIGFLIALFSVLIYKNRSKTINKLSKMTVIMVLFTTVGGFAVIFAYFVTPDIRAYNRISIFIATISFFILAITLNNYVVKYKISTLKVALFIPFIVIIGLYDQLFKTASLKQNDVVIKEFNIHKEFVKSIELISNNDKILIAQYPFMPYPENGPINNLKDYAQIYGYVHSNHISWSYPVVRGRVPFFWWEDLLKKSLKEQIEILENAGFSGLTIDRDGYKDNADKIENEIKLLLNQVPMESQDKKILYFRLNPKTPSQIIIPPKYINFYPWEGEEGLFRWSTKDAKIELYKTMMDKKDTLLSFYANSLIDRTVQVYVNDKPIDKFFIQSGRVEKHEYELILKEGE